MHMLYVYLFLLLPVITALGHMAFKQQKGRCWSGVWLRHIVFWIIGIGGIFAYLFNAFDWGQGNIARWIGWTTGGPWQTTVGIASLAFGVLGVLSFLIDGWFLVATVDGWIVWAIGKAWVLFFNNANTDIKIYSLVFDLFIPAVLLFLLFKCWSSGHRSGKKGKR